MASDEDSRATEPSEESPLLASPANGEDTHGSPDGDPELAQKLRVLVPALAVGIFLSALDQTLIVATYAKISSDLEALNRTSWISTSYVPSSCTLACTTQESIFACTSNSGRDIYLLFFRLTSA